jgi:hypothetical protein
MESARRVSREHLQNAWNTSFIVEGNMVNAHRLGRAPDVGQANQHESGDDPEEIPPDPDLTHRE